MLLRAFKATPLSPRDQQYLVTLRKVYEQQLAMYRNWTHCAIDWIVNIHEPYVRSIVKGKEKAKVEFGSKINVSLVNGYPFIDYLSWDAFKERIHLKESNDKYKIDMDTICRRYLLI